MRPVARPPPRWLRGRSELPALALLYHGRARTRAHDAHPRSRVSPDAREHHPGVPDLRPDPGLLPPCAVYFHPLFQFDELHPMMRAHAPARTGY
jgi:hypothetical protein